MNLLEFQQKFSSEQACRDWLADKRWGNEENPICPHCNSKQIYTHSDGKLYSCSDCKKQFTVRIGTIFEDSRLPLFKWFIAIYLFTSLKKGISSIQLSKYINVTQKTAWFILHRIREVMDNSDDQNLFEGTAEIDEAYLGGSESNKRTSKKGKTEKMVVIGMVNRESQTVRAFKIHTNSIEGFWGELKQGIKRIYHWVSKKHINKYLNERKITDFEKFAVWFDKCEDKKLSICRIN